MAYSAANIKCNLCVFVTETNTIIVLFHFESNQLILEWRNWFSLEILDTRKIIYTQNVFAYKKNIIEEKHQFLVNLNISFWVISEPIRLWYICDANFWHISVNLRLLYCVGFSSYIWKLYFHLVVAQIVLIIDTFKVINQCLLYRAVSRTIATVVLYIF